MLNIALNLSDFFHRWQTLLAGLLALSGAGWTVRVIQSQIKQTSDAENDRRDRNERAARAILPLALHDISDYARECMLLMSPFISDSAHQNPIIVPPIPPALIEPLQAAVRSANPQTAAELSARCTSLYPYARGDEPEITPGFNDRLQEGLLLAVGDVLNHPSVARLVKQRQNPSPIGTRLDYPTSTAADPAPSRTNPATP